MTKGWPGGSMREEAFAKVVGSPGANPRFMAFVRAVWPVLLLLFFAGYALRAAIPFPSLSAQVAGWLLVGCCLALAGAIFLRGPRLAAYAKGARGEERVARMLHRLPAGYTVIHGLQAGSGAQDIDHVVLGPTGIFVIETKNWEGRICVRDGVLLCNDERPSRDPVEQSKSAASALQALLSEKMPPPCPIRPILCFAGGARLAGENIQGVSGVRLSSTGDLLMCLLEDDNDSLTDEQVKAVVSCLVSQEN